MNTRPSARPKTPIAGFAQRGTAAAVRSRLLRALLAVVLPAALNPVHAADPSDRDIPMITKPVTGAVSAAATGKAGTANTLHWYDGARRRAVREQPGATLDAKGVSAPAARAVAKSSAPLFVDADGSGTVRALPGGVVVRLAQSMTLEALSERLEAFDVRVERRLGDSGRLWLLAGGPGNASIILANAIHESGLVESASPNWVTPRVRK